MKEVKGQRNSVVAGEALQPMNLNFECVAPVGRGMAGARGKMHDGAVRAWLDDPPGSGRRNV